MDRCEARQATLRAALGGAVTRAGVVRGFAGEPEPGRRLDLLARHRRVAAVRLLDPFVDIGTPEALAAVSGEA